MFIGAAALGYASTTTAFGTAFAASVPSNGSFKTLMDRVEQIGDQLPLTSAAEQNAYIYGLAAAAMLVDEFPLSKMGAYGKTGVEIGPLGRTEPPTDRVHGVALIGYRMAPNAWLQPHNHP